MVGKLKTNINQTIQNVDQETLECVFKNMKTRLNFVVWQWGWKFERLVKKRILLSLGFVS